jgi:hypothetical protein
MTQINETNYCFMIDKKVKDGYEYPKIFILPYRWTSEMYCGTLMECELIRDQNRRWSIGIGDIYYGKGKNLRGTIVMDRITEIHECLRTCFLESDFTTTCPIFVKHYFDYKDIEQVVDVLVPKLPYDIRGFYFVPLRCDYSKLLHLLPRDNPMNVQKKKTNIPTEIQPATSASSAKPVSQTTVRELPVNLTMDTYESSVNDTNSSRLFRIMKTLKPDVYEVYSVDQGEFQKQGNLLVQSTECSHRLFEIFRGKSQSDDVRVACIKNTRFCKWEPTWS